MKKFTFLVSVASVVLDNSIDALIPEVWANEALLRLEQSMVMGNLVYRDYSKEVASFGNIVHAHRPGEFVSQNKGVNDNVTVQAASATDTAVRLDQHHHVSFLLRDGEEAMAMVDLISKYLVPAVSALAQGVDQSIWGEAYNFMGTNVGQLGTDPTKATLTRLRAKLSNNLAPMDNRNLVISPNIASTLLDIADFSSAEKVGDAGTAIRTGSLGNRLGFNIIETQNAPSIAAGSNDTTARAIDHTGGYAAGTTVLTIDTATVVTVGSWVTVVGDMTPLQVTASTATTLTVSPALSYAVADDAVVTVYTPAAVNLVAGYEAFKYTDLAIDGLTAAPQVGQMLSLGTARYGAKSGTTNVLAKLNTTAQAAVANDAVMGIGPAGEYGFAFHPNAIALVTRPLAAPKTGALSYVANYNGLSMRVCITYDGNKQGHLVTLDFLTGVKTLDTRLGAIVFA